MEDLAFTIPEACKAGKTSRSELYRAIKRGELTLRKRGKKSLILVTDLRRWVESLPIAASSNAA